MSALFSPLILRGLTLDNRIVVSPMCQYIAADGLANAWHRTHLGNLASSGASMLCIESTAVEPEGRITPGDLGLWSDETEAALKAVLDPIREYSKVAVTLQLGHAGRKASSHTPWDGGQLIPVSEGGWTPLAPSALVQKMGEALPAMLDAAGLDRLRVAFAAATKRAVRLGVDGIEVHGAHGYLLHQFFSPLSNHRTDAYGGSFENRIRFPLEIFDIVRATFPADKPIGMKISASDWAEGGASLDDTIAFAEVLRARGADWVTVSSGGISEVQQVEYGPGFQVPFAQAVRSATGVVTTAVGMITEAHQAEDIIAGGKADLVAIARGMLYDPRWAWHAAAELGASVEAPPPYWRAPPGKFKDLFRGTTHGAR
jgi:2,4-dienoyl-CoA reductase-like NADH-dependent reductase (Old Yellow Enzyme family)